MTVVEFWDKLTVGGLAGWAVMILLILLSLIQISPIKLNPWDKVLAWLGSKINKNIHNDVKELREKIGELEQQTQELWINSHRSFILVFARECRAGVKHDSEEWANCLNQCATYEAFIKAKNYPNGIVQSNIDYVRDLYQELSREHRI